MGVLPRWGRAGGLGGAEYGRAVAGQGHAFGAVAAHQPAEAGAQAKKPAQDVGVPVGVRVFAGVGGDGEEPILGRAAQRAAGDPRHGKGGQQGQQQALQRHRQMGVQDRPRPGARCVGFARCGGRMWHHREFAQTQHRWTR